MREVTVAATQMACSWERGDNLAGAEALVREAAGRGASWGLFRDRRPDLYGALLTLDGVTGGR